MINTKTIVQRRSALFSGLLAEKLDDYIMNDFSHYFWNIATALKGKVEGMPYVRTENGMKFVDMVGSSHNMVTKAYRGFFKTDVHLHRLLHLAITENSDSIIVCETDALATEKADSIKKFIETNPRMKRYLPKKDNSVLWNSSTLQIVDRNKPIREEVHNPKTGGVDIIYKQKVIASLKFTSLQAGIRGGRATNVLLDDIITEGTSSSMEKIFELNKTISEKIVPMMNSGGSRLFVVGTPQHKKDYLEQCLASPLFDKFVLKVKENGNLTNVPFRKDVKEYCKKNQIRESEIFIQDEKWYEIQVARMSPNGRETHPFFQREYFLNISGVSDSSFDDATINKCLRHTSSFGYRPKRSDMVRIMGIDTSNTLDIEKAKRNDNDFNAVVICDYNLSTHDVYVIEVSRTRDLKSFPQIISDLIDRYGVEYLAYEGWNISTIIQEGVLAKYKDQEGFLMDTKSGNKVQAINDLLSYFINSLIHVPYQNEDDQKRADVLLEEFKMVNKANIHDDLADCLVRITRAALKLKDSDRESADLDESIVDLFRGIRKKKEVSNSFNW